MEMGSMAVVLAVLAALSVPLLMRWYHPLLVISWNAAINPVVLPGRTSLWMVMTVVSLFFAVLSRAVNSKARFIHIPPVTYSLLFMAVVAVITVSMTGGVGLASMGSSRFGGGRYVQLLMGIAGYFALTSRRIPPHRAGLYVACFFLSGMTYAVADIALLVGPQMGFLLAIFGGGATVDPNNVNASMVRVWGLGMMATAIYTYLLARFGIRGVLDLNRPWRLLAFLLVLSIGLAGGFRSYVAIFALTFIALFFFEGLHRTRYLPIVLGAVVLGGTIILSQADRLPLVAQRALSFLPGRFNFDAMESARSTTVWRLEMWRQVLPDVPKYLFHGKGYVLDPTELYLAGVSQHRFRGEGLAGTIVAGDYHNGPLSILIPFGIYGMIAFVWFLVAGTRTLYRNYKFGDPAYRTVNTFLLGAFVARTFWFFLFFGGFHSDIAYFTGLLGLGVALNGADVTLRTQPEVAAVDVELNTEYIRA
jgi:hypothetical protein